MSHSLLFIPDISGFTNFIQTTEVEHSQHVIAELLEILIGANNSGFELAEIEGDALFFFKEKEILSLEMLLAQVESMFTAFYSHLKLLETNRICPCNACASAPNLNLKIIVHCGELQFITVQDKRKPFGAQVIEVHRMLKNSVDSDNYVLVSKTLSSEIGLDENYKSKMYNFQAGLDEYDGKQIEYLYSLVNSDSLKLKPFEAAKKVEFKRPPNMILEFDFPIDAHSLLEYITNYKYRHYWTDGLDQLVYDENIVTRAGTEHKCVVKGSDLDFTAITKESKAGQLVYGEYTTSIPSVDEVFQFYNFIPQTHNSCRLVLECYWNVKSPFMKIMMMTLGKIAFRKKIQEGMSNLLAFAKDADNIISK